MNVKRLGVIIAATATFLVLTAEGCDPPPPPPPPPPTTTTTTAPPPPPTTTTTTTPPPPPTTTTTTVAPPPAVRPVGITTGNWTIPFADEFTGTALNTAKWVPNWLGNPTAITKPINSSELSCYDPKQVSVAGGNLVLKIVANSPARPGCVIRSGATAAYASGMVESNGKFNGYVPGTFAEARIWLSPEGGTPTNWDSFWSDGTGQWPTTGEIDVMEVLSGGTTRWHIHDTSGAPGGGPSLKGGWHTFGAYRKVGSVEFFYDGKSVGSGSLNTTAPHYLIANLGIGTGSVKEVPATMLVDWIRVYKAG